MNDPAAPSALWQFFGSPLANVLGIAIGVLGIALAFFFYRASRKEPELRYAINPSRAVVVDSKRASHLDVFVGGEKVESDVSAVLLAVWNAGRASIRPEQVIEPIVFTLPDGIRVLEITTFPPSRPSTEFTAIYRGNDRSQIAVSWRIIEKNDGAKFQLIYAGNPSAQIAVTGLVEGQGPPKRVDWPAPPMDVSLLGGLIFMLGFSVTLPVIVAVRDIFFPAIQGKTFAEACWMAVAIFGLSSIALLLWRHNRPPGFFQ